MQWWPDTQSNYRMHKQTFIMTEMPFFHMAGFPGLFFDDVFFFFSLSSLYLQTHHML